MTATCLDKRARILFHEPFRRMYVMIGLYFSSKHLANVTKISKKSNIFAVSNRLRSLMDRISDSGSDGCGSIPHGGTRKARQRLAFLVCRADKTYWTLVMLKVAVKVVLSAFWRRAVHFITPFSMDSISHHWRCSPSVSFFQRA